MVLAEDVLPNAGSLYLRYLHMNDGDEYGGDDDEQRR